MESAKQKIVLYKRIIYQAQKYGGVAYGNFVRELLSGIVPNCVDLMFHNKNYFLDFVKNYKIFSLTKISNSFGLNTVECYQVTLDLIIVNCYYSTNGIWTIFGIDCDVNALQVTALEEVENDDIITKPDEFGLVFQVVPQLLELFPHRLSITKIMTNIKLKQMDCIGMLLSDISEGHSCFHNQKEHIHYCQNSPIGEIFRTNLIGYIIDGWTPVNKCDDQQCWLKL